MLKIEVRKEQNNIVIDNATYPNSVVCTDITTAPDIGVEYIYLQWSDAVWYEKFYVDLNNHIQAFTEEQLLYIEDICTNWIQPLGQEGNLTLEQSRVLKNKEILSAFNGAVKTIVSAQDHEMVSWRKQEEEAKAYVVDNSALTPMIDAILSTRNLGETKQELVDKIISNAGAYGVAYGTLLGTWQNKQKQVELSLTVDEVNLIGW